MRASNTYPSNGSKVTKIAIVTLLHVGVVLALISMKVAPKDTQKKEAIDVVITDPVPVEREKIKVDTSTEKLKPTIFIPDDVPVTVQPPPDTAPTGSKQPVGPLKDNIGGTDKGTDKVAEVKVDKISTGPTTIGSDCVRPDYPARAARNGDTGTVSLALLIGADGRVTDAKVKQSSGFKDLDRAALSALSMCKFKPATSNGVAQASWGQIAYVWSLD